MAISKRLRFEILRRDNHTCRYCGAAPPDTTLTVDHVIPTTLGGTDEPTNLVAACRECNSGKTSIHPDTPLVSNVADDAVRWAKAMELVAAQRAAERDIAAENHAKFHAKWNEWTYQRGENTFAVPLPSGWKTTLNYLMDAGLTPNDLTALIETAMSSRADDPWRYFCGCCWREITHRQETARELIDIWDCEGEDTM